MRLRTRLQKLERSRTFAGCPGCRHRRVIVLRTCTPLPDGSVVWDVDEPQPCARCGQIPEQIIEMILSVVDERNDDAQSRASA
jgi:DNA-directed RNA polymerase subunit RPC12/RpoP